MSSLVISWSACVAIFQLMVQLVLAKDFGWCDPSLCEPTQRHIACRNTGVSHTF